MEYTQKEYSDQIQYLPVFEYNEKTYRRPIFSDNQLEKASIATRIKHAETNAKSLLKLERQLVPRSTISHIHLYDKDGNMLAYKDKYTE